MCCLPLRFYTLNVDEIESVLNDNFDAETAEKEWNRIRNTVRAADMRMTTVDTGKVLTETRHVTFGSMYFKDAFSTFVERDVVDELSAMRAPSETPMTPRNAPMSSELTTPRGTVGTPRATPRRKRVTRPSFRSLQNMFHRSSSKGDLRDEKVISLHQRNRNSGTLAYASPPSDFYQRQYSPLHEPNQPMDDDQVEAGISGTVQTADDHEEINNDLDNLARIRTDTPTMTDDECLVLTMKSSTGYGAIPPILTPLDTIPSNLNHTT